MCNKSFEKAPLGGKREKLNKPTLDSKKINQIITNGNNLAFIFLSIIS